MTAPTPSSPRHLSGVFFTTPWIALHGAREDNTGSMTGSETRECTNDGFGLD